MQGDTWRRNYSVDHRHPNNCELCGQLKTKHQNRMKCDADDCGSLEYVVAIQWDHCHMHNIVRGALCRTCNIEEESDRQNGSWGSRFTVWRYRCPRCAPGAREYRRACRSVADPQDTPDDHRLSWPDRDIERGTKYTAAKEHALGAALDNAWQEYGDGAAPRGVLTRARIQWGDVEWTPAGSVRTTKLYPLDLVPVARKLTAKRRADAMEGRGGKSARSISQHGLARSLTAALHRRYGAIIRLRDIDSLVLMS